jgi:hypothetical protein
LKSLSKSISLYKSWWSYFWVIYFLYLKLLF